MRLSTYDDGFFEDDGTFGDGVWDAVGQIGGQIGSTLFSSILGGTSGGTQFRGLAGVNQAGQQAIQALQQILAAAQAGQMSPAQAVSEAQRIAGVLSNSQVVYQAQHGDDAEALQQWKARAAALVQQIQSAVSLAASGTPAGGVPAGGVSSLPPIAGAQTPVSIAGFSVNPSTLLLLGGGIALLLLLKKE